MKWTLQSKRHVEIGLCLLVVGLALVGFVFCAFSVRADEFRAVVVTDSESAALRSAKARADEARTAFETLRSATEQKYRERLGCYSFDWSLDFRVIAEPRATIYSQPWSITPSVGMLTPFYNSSHADLRSGWPGTVELYGAAPIRESLMFGGDGATDTNGPPPTASVFGDLPPINGSVRTEWDGLVHGSVGGPITLGVVPGAVAK